MKFKFFLYTVLLVVVASCSKIRQITNEITDATPREIYKREFASDSIYAIWENAYKRATADSLQISLPYGESGTFRPYDMPVYSYEVNMEEGEVLSARVERDSVKQQIFIDIFEMDGSRTLKAVGSGTGDLAHAVGKTGRYKVIIQPEIVAGTDFTILISKSPLYGFPVAGKGNKAIQSFWGYERDGGKRSHEGVDIFAARGTPVIAVADGVVSNVGDRGLGGKQVWQRIANNGHSIYYAHLDSIKAVSGLRVSKGDTLGFVGSTGNAKGGPPHLHFGIYKNFEGAVNPLAFIYSYPKISASAYKNTVNKGGLRVKNMATLRLGPTTSAAKIGALQKNAVIKVLGQHHDWLHILTADEQRAFIHKSLVSI